MLKTSLLLGIPNPKPCSLLKKNADCSGSVEDVFLKIGTQIRSFFYRMITAL